MLLLILMKIIENSRKNKEKGHFIVLRLTEGESFVLATCFVTDLFHWLAPYNSPNQQSPKLCLAFHSSQPMERFFLQTKIVL